MKKIVLIISLIALVSVVNAQTKAANEKNKSQSFGLLIGEFAKGLKPSSFSPAWSAAKKSWNEEMKSASNLADAKTILSTLVNNINPSAFSLAFSQTKNQWQDGVNTAKSIAELASSVKMLTNGILPTSYIKEFNVQKSDFLNHLGSLR